MGPSSVLTRRHQPIKTCVRWTQNAANLHPLAAPHGQMIQAWHTHPPHPTLHVIKSGVELADNTNRVQFKLLRSDSTVHVKKFMDYIFSIKYIEQREEKITDGSLKTLFSLHFNVPRSYGLTYVLIRN